MVETINDKDGNIANVWRAIAYAPEETAKICDWPVNHADLCARRRRLLAEQAKLLENLISDDKYYHIELAGYWIWAASCWIGSGLTRPGAMPRVDGLGVGVHAGKVPHITGKKGIHIGERPQLSFSQGINAGQVPQITTNKGINAGKRPDLGGQFSVNKRCHSKGDHIYEWFSDLSHRLRNVRVVCGDWSRVCGGNWQDNRGNVGIFFDPPYAADRDDVYAEESFNVAHDVRKWCIERGDKPTYRIVLCGYGEHEELADHGWTFENWKTKGGYSNQKKGYSRGKANAKKEMIWYSPHCIGQGRLF